MRKLNFIIFTSIAVASVILSATGARADEISVVDVRRNITLSDDEPVYKDFYVNAGDGSALRKNMVINVKRKLYVKESATKTVGDFEALVGQIKIIHIGNKVSVAREFKLTSRDEEPMLEQIGIMSGDRLDMNGAFIDNSKPNYKRKTSEAEPKKEETVKTAALTSEAVTVTESASSAPAVTAPVAPPAQATPSVPAGTEGVKPDTREPANDKPTLLQKIIPIPKLL
jgi:hypothetical protein